MDRALDVLAAGLLPDAVVVTHEFRLDDYRVAIETALDRDIARHQGRVPALGVKRSPPEEP